MTQLNQPVLIKKILKFLALNKTFFTKFETGLDLTIKSQKNKKNEIQILKILFKN